VPEFVKLPVKFKVFVEDINVPAFVKAPVKFVMSGAIKVPLLMVKDNKLRGVELSANVPAPDFVRETDGEIIPPSVKVFAATVTILFALIVIQPFPVPVDYLYLKYLHLKLFLL